MKTANPIKTKTTKRPARKAATSKTVAADLAVAKREQGQSVTEIIEAALEKHLTAAAPRKPRMTLLEAFEKNGLLGTVDMPPDASRNYKQYISEYLDEKYPQHGHR